MPGSNARQRGRLSRASLTLLAVASAAIGQSEDDFDPLTVDVVDAINCHIDARTFNGFAFSLSEADQLRARGWRKVGSANPFLYQYRLPKPVAVAGGYTTRDVVLSAGGIMAVLDLPDPSALARAEQIENAADPEPLLDGLVAEGSLTPEQARAMPRTGKFLGERVIVDETERDDQLKATIRTTIRRAISTVTSHPGKTLYGCAYKIDLKFDGEAD